MKRMTYFVMALAMVLGFTQCKKEETPANNQTEGVFITLDVNGGNNGSRVNVNPTGADGYATVAFEDDDIIYVGFNNKYVGTLTYSGTAFSGSVDITDDDMNQANGEPLHFYFLGGVGFEPTVDGNTATVNISDQSSKYPVISYAPSRQAFTGAGSYSAKLQNRVSIMKFNVTTPSTAPICITGMNNEVTVNFNPETEDDRFGYGMNTTDGGLIKMPSKDANNETWAIVLPQAALEETGEAFSEDNAYFGTRPALSAIGSNQYLSSGVSMTVNTPAWDGDLSKLTEGVSERYATATNGMTISGTLTADVKVSIADGATVTLDGANINNGSKSGSVSCAGITCVGSATINLIGGSIINSSSAGYPGIQAGPSGNTLTIQGAGSLSAQGGSNAAGIGGGSGITCGNISLKGGAITACGGQYGAGIGSGQGGTCGNIEIVGGEITATGGEGAAGIGSGSGINTVCGNIYLYGGIINACGGNGAAGIGSGQGGSCGNVDIEGGTITAEGGDGASNIGAGEGGECGTVTLHPINGLFSVSPTEQVRFSRGNLLSDGTFAVNQCDRGDNFSSNKWTAPSADWYVLSADEWEYLCHRINKVGFATVNDIHGLIILPDDYSGSITKPYDFNNTTYTTYPWNDNIYSGDTWATMENNGVVFLPVTGTLASGQYWSSSVCFQFSCQGSGSSIGSGPWNTSISLNPNQRFACVRLVRTEQTN